MQQFHSFISVSVSIHSYLTHIISRQITVPCLTATMAPGLVVKLPLRATLLQRWPASRQLKTTSQASISASASTAGAIQATPAIVVDSMSNDQRAIALTIVKSKPNDISPSEYCQNLVKHFQEGQPKPIERYKYIDTTGYWKDQCDKIHQEKEALQNKVTRLEEAQRILMEKYRSIEGSGGEEHIGPENRTVVGEQRLATGTSRKRPAISQDIPEDQDESLDLDNDAYLQLSACVLRIARQQTDLGKAMDQIIESHTVNRIENLSKNVIQTISIIEKSISDCCLPLRLLEANIDNQRTVNMLRRVLLHVARAFNACFNGMDRLFRTMHGRSKQREIVYRTVMFFRSSLDLLKTVSALQSEDEQIRQNQSTRSKRPRVEFVEYAVNKYLAQTLASIANEVDWDVRLPGHSEILEGMLVVVIQHTGRLLSDAVFGEDITAERGIVRLETRYVLPILYAALGGANRREQVNRVLSREFGDPRSFPTTSRNPALGASGSSGTNEPRVIGELLKKVRTLLQSTLLQNTLGTNDLGGLTLPPAPAEMSEIEDTRQGEEKYGKEWLLETVWGLLGWDLVTDDLT
ncbi:hypothetical protein VTL71DRAFT_513 [Oculimacula yallundae]|uniref:Uncharacterized protein n=1 Tax=Oculimacula yallundae TaxID=86028 RepID=A0ABR4D0E9_9HELO